MLLQNSFGLSAIQFSNLDLAQPVLMHLLQLHVAVALVHEHQRVRHAALPLELRDNRLLLVNFVLQRANTLRSVLNVVQLLQLRLLLQQQVFLDVPLL